MNVPSNGSRSLAALRSASSFSRGTRSILFSTRILGCPTRASLVRIASASSSMPVRASISTQTRSASCAPLHAVETMARSSRRLGENIPGVSTRMICALSSMTMPRISARVVCTLRETMVTLEPTSALTSVDFPTLGAPIRATKPQRVGAGATSPDSLSVIAAAANAFTRDHDGCRDFLRRALAAAEALGRRQTRQIHRDPKLRIMVWPGTLYLAINRRWQAFALRPFLQHGLWIAKRPPVLAHPLGPVALHELGRRRITAIEKHRADHGLADVTKHRLAQPRARAGPDRSEFDIVDQREGLGHIGAALLAHEVGQAFREFAFIGPRKGAIEHVRYDQTEHVIAEEFQPLVTVATLARRFKGGHVRQGGGQKLGVRKLVTDTRLKRGGSCRGRFEPKGILGALPPGRGRGPVLRLRACFAWS